MFVCASSVVMYRILKPTFINILPDCHIDKTIHDQMLYQSQNDEMGTWIQLSLRTQTEGYKYSEFFHFCLILVFEKWLIPVTLDIQRIITFIDASCCLCNLIFYIERDFLVEELKLCYFTVTPWNPAP